MCSVGPGVVGTGSASGPRRSCGGRGGQRRERARRRADPRGTGVRARRAGAPSRRLASLANGAPARARRRRGCLAGRSGGSRVARAARGGRRHGLGGGLRRADALAHGSRPGGGSVALRGGVRGGEVRSLLSGSRPMKPRETERVYSGTFFDVVVETWDGRVRELVERTVSVAIVAVDLEGRVVLVRQFREAVREKLLELPAGIVDDDERPLEAARRELREETGLRGGRWRELRTIHPSPGFVREPVTIFLAEELDEGEPDLDEGEEVGARAADSRRGGGRARRARGREDPRRPAALRPGARGPVARHGGRLPALVAQAKIGVHAECEEPTSQRPGEQLEDGHARVMRVVVSPLRHADPGRYIAAGLFRKALRCSGSVSLRGPCASASRRRSSRRSTGSR